MFVTWKRLCVFVCLAILFVIVMQTNIYVKSIHLVVYGSCVDVRA